MRSYVSLVLVVSLITSTSDLEATRLLSDLYRRSVFHFQKQPEIHLFAARFKELSGDIVGAHAEYQNLYSEISPGLLEAFVKLANMEYQVGNKEAAFSVYERAISSGLGKGQSQLLPFLIIQYSRFIYLAGYAVYGGYGNYGQPQVTTSASQGTAYGAYPPTYPVEAHPQPSFPRPSANPRKTNIASPLVSPKIGFGP
ncbi:hypothetical protein OPV22_002306 [Ensete ventricosum]|uniref:Uncharacterized protein n=1 Tax=Ensete ventricosum TaxID=4639 RepID=A0AAV8RXJ1_ENSVE|nr:hypothetical protein OPV22_002306 [Ensete ventricosum]